MFKNKFWMILLLALAVSAVWVIGVLADTIYLPVIVRDPTLTPSLTPTATQTTFPTVTSTPPTPTRTPTRTPGVYIDDINNGSTTSDLNDENIILSNTRSTTVDLEDWRITSDSEGAQDLNFNISIAGNGTITIWSKLGTNTSTNYYLGRAEPFWNNSGDCAYLRDEDRDIVDIFCYGSSGDYIFKINP